MDNHSKKRLIGAVPPAAVIDEGFNFKEKFCCRFAADTAAADRRHNYLLRLAAVSGAGSICIESAGRHPNAFPGAERKAIVAAPDGCRTLSHDCPGLRCPKSSAPTVISY